MSYTISMEILELISDPSVIIWSGIASLFIILMPLIWNHIRNYRMQKAIFDIQKDVKEIKLMFNVSSQKATNNQSLANTEETPTSSNVV